MSAIADSSAVSESKKILSQHQAVLSIIQGRIAIPSVTNFRWLDLCCGLGQTIINLEENFTTTARKKIEYSCQDIKADYIKATQKKAESLEFKNVTAYTTDIAVFQNNIPLSPPFDFITLINAVHEINPYDLPSIVYEAIIRLESNGTLYIFDMESIKPYELGAIPWTREEIVSLFTEIFKPIVIDTAEFEVNKWRHTTTTSWSTEIKKAIFKPQEELLHLKQTVLSNVKKSINKALNLKLETCEKMLESLTKFGATTTEDQENKIKLLYDFFSLQRLLKKNV